MVNVSGIPKSGFSGLFPYNTSLYFWLYSHDVCQDITT